MDLTELAAEVLEHEEVRGLLAEIRTVREDPSWWAEDRMKMVQTPLGKMLVRRITFNVDGFTEDDYNDNFG